MSPEGKSLISVVVPVYNRAEIVETTLSSLAAQTVRPLHIILVDNNSTDSTHDTLLSWARWARRPGFYVEVTQCAEPGAAAARNAGLALVTTPWVMFFDSDDIMPPTHVTEAIVAMAERPEADIIGWDYISVKGSERHLNRFFGTDMMWNNLFHGAMSSARWCARTDLVRRAGGWNGKVRYWDDIELGTRMLKLNPVIYYRGVSGVVVLTHSDSISGDYTADPSRIESALQSIEQVLGHTMWTDIKRSIEYARTTAAGNNRGRMLQRQLMSRSSLGRRLLLWWVYHYTRRGMPGAARLAKPFVRILR